MTVKCINELQKAIIAREFLDHGVSIEHLVDQYARSRRTIIRVLEEQGVDPQIRRRKPKAPTPPQLPLPITTVIPTRSPWYRRILDKVFPVLHFTP